ncbi:trans-sulfuration enzyme family protein [Undibacterium sp. TJN19]|uniref:trans-sulfuration enzyme family protein n=1 Tax=Undibacterium sp. TJN19 TaxID=3413055 RepID=UPI003BF3A31C
MPTSNADPSRDSSPDSSTDIATQLVQPAQGLPAGFASLSQGVFHASTIVFPDVASFLARQNQAYDGYSYGQNGTPTHYALTGKLAELEGGGKTVLVPTGLAAAVLVNSMLLSAGDHVLLPETVYGPTLEMTQALFGKWGVTCTLYPNDIAADISKLFQPRTRLVWTESPSSNTLEMQDVPAIVKAAHAQGILVAMDNTWATPLGFRPLDVGVDFSIQALTKYVGGHSDLLMGAVSTRDEKTYQDLRDTAELIGYYVASDECFLALRGLPTMALRMERQFSSALRIARFLQDHAAVASIHYPPLESDTYHCLWKRDFKLGSGLLSFTLKNNTLPAIEDFVAALKLFTLGNSWGGVHSLVAVAPLRKTEDASDQGWLIRLHVGVEDVNDLLNDLGRALSV